MTRSQEFILKHRKKLSDGAAFFNPDTTFMPQEKFETAKLKFLLVFSTPLITKTVSSTFAAINDYVIEHCPDVFLDCAYMPEGSDLKLYDDEKMPYAIGEITHLDASHFDVVGFSISVLSEIITAPVMLKSFERCDKPIPLFWSERKDLSVNECPVIYTGGITENCGDSMFGEPVPGKIAYIDFQYLGACDKTDILFNRLIEAKSTGLVHRSVHDNDKLGYHYDYSEDFETEIKVNTIQDYVESLFDLNFIYQPQAYKVVFNKDNQIIENTKINPKARDFVTPYYPHQMPDDLGIGRTLINANGDNCLVKGTRVKCFGGYKKIEDLAQGDCVYGLDGFAEFEEVIPSKGRVIELKLNQGVSIRATEEHRQVVWDGSKITEKFIKDIHPGDWVASYVGNDSGKSVPGSLAYFAGLWFGDGYRAGGEFKWNKGDYYIAQSVAVHETKVLSWVLDSGYYHEIQSGTPSVRCFGLEKHSELAKFIYSQFPHYKDDISSVLMWGTSEQLSFLRGLFDADGTSDKGGCVSLAMKSSRLRVIEDVMVILNEFGIRTHLMDSRITRAFGKEFGRVELKIVGSDSYRKFFDYIGFTEDHKSFQVRGLKGNEKDKCVPASLGPVLKDMLYKQGFRANLWRKETGVGLDGFLRGNNGTKLRNIIELGSCYSNELISFYQRGFAFTQVSEVRNLGDSEVFDIKNVDGHLFVAETFLTHNCGTTQTQVSDGCSAGGQCSFCSEGAYTGGWVEKRRDRILEELWEAKKYSAGYKYKPFSFNCNYVTDYKGILAEFIQIYPKVTFINMRLEELGRDTDALRIMKAIGSNRISAPIEGLSPRVQNNLLNKCLSQEAFDNFMFDLVHMKMTDIKVGGIYTGYETDEDFQWICDYVHKFKEKAKDEGGNLPFRLKMTPLVSYPLTACEYIERKSARKSYNGERWLSDEWYEKFKENEIFFKVNGFRYSTFIEQSIVDLGRSLTPMIYRHFVKPMAPIYSLRSVATDEFVNELKAFINPDKFFELRDPEHYISIAHRIHIDLMGSYIPRARRLIRAYQNGNIFDNEMDIRCLKTFEGAKVKCYHNCIKDDPLKIYHDVKMDEEGNLHGEFDLLLGCERCQTPEQRKARLARPTPQTKNVDDIIAVPRIPIRQRLRFVIKRSRDFDVLNPNNTAHTFMTKFLQLSDNLLHKYHSIVNHNMFWNADPGLPYFVSGFQVVDTFWQDDVLDEVRSLIPEVNKMLKSVQVISVKEELREEKIDVNDVNIWYFESELPAEMFSASTRMYDGEVKVMGGGMMGAIETIIDKDLKAPVFATKGKTLGFFALPCKYNPVLFLSSFLKAKKTSPAQVVQSTIFECAMTMREATAVCKHCGKERALVSVTTGKQLPFGKECVCKALLSQRLKG